MRNAASRSAGAGATSRSATALGLNAAAPGVGGAGGALSAAPGSSRPMGSRVLTSGSRAAGRQPRPSGARAAGEPGPQRRYRPVVPGRQPSAEAGRGARGRSVWGRPLLIGVVGWVLVAAGLRVAVALPERCPAVTVASVDAAADAAVGWFAT